MSDLSVLERLTPWVELPDPRYALAATDPVIYAAIEKERARQTAGIELIASENYVSPAVLAAMGSVLTNKYAEGYPGRRYYGGCEFVDVVEQLAIDRAKELFGAEHANVQPHSGAQANAAAYMALLELGDVVLGLKLDHGGHLTHGFHLNQSGKLYNFKHYGVHQQTERLDYDELEALAHEHHPKLIVVGASAYPRHFDFPRLRAIADAVGARLMMDMAHVAGLIAADLHPDPVPYCDVVTSTTHKTLRGPRAGLILCREEWAKAIDKAVFPGIQGGPLMHIIAAKAVAFHEATQPDFKAYQQRTLDNAQALARREAAVIVQDVDPTAAVAPNRVRQGLRLVSGGTDNHLMLVDMTPAGVTGKAAEKALDAAGIHTNKNMIPFDPKPPLTASGIRLGTPAATTRGFGPDDMRQVGRWIGEIVHHVEDPAVIERVHRDVIEFACRFPVPA